MDLCTYCNVDNRFLHCETEQKQGELIRLDMTDFYNRKDMKSVDLTREIETSMGFDSKNLLAKRKTGKTRGKEIIITSSNSILSLGIANVI